MKKKGNRRKISWVLAVVLCLSVALVSGLSLISSQPAIAQAAKHYTELTFPPLPELQVPEYSRFQTKNGMTVYLMEDHELPLVSGIAMFHTGDRLEPADKVGLAGLVGEVMRAGGTQRRSPDALNQLLEQRAASVESGIDVDSGNASFSALSEDLETVFDLFAEVIRQPAFAEEQLELKKNQRRGGIARRNDDPNSIASREFQKVVYGSSSPYARTIEYATLDNISREDLVNFYRQYFYPNNMLLGIVGDFDSKTMRQLIEAKFGDWKPATLPSTKLPAVNQANPTGIFLVDQPQLTQSYIQMGHLGGLLSNPDHAALSVMNGVLNGFGGRLFNQVRSRQGLSYTVYGAWSPQYDYPGLLIAGGQTRSEATVPFIQSLFTELERIRSTPISAAELTYAKDSVLNSFIFNFQDPSQTLSRLMRYEYYGYPKDFIFQYRRGVEATTISDVQRVAQKYLKPENIVTLVVGNGEAIQPPLSSLGDRVKVTPVDITIPQPVSGKQS